MRKPTYYSPTSINLWFSDRTEFYTKYLADNRPPKMIQTQPMSIGSAFDAHIKSYLYARLYGATIPEFEFETLFESQVESQNRDWARIHGQNAFDQYKAAGAISDLMVELERARALPKFEYRLEDNIDLGDRTVRLCGYPDLFFELDHTYGIHHVIYDFKVNGYCSKSPKSPDAGYVRLRDGWRSDYAKPSRVRGAHKDAVIKNVAGIITNAAAPFEKLSLDWATQCTVYSWLEGTPIGDPVIAGIEQLACKPDPNRPGFALIRVASHRGLVSRDFQIGLKQRIKQIDAAIESGHIFDDLSYDESLAKQQQLDEMFKAYDTGNPNLDQYTRSLMGR